jgi:hypothetical protein
MSGRLNLSPVDLALIGFFSALWVVLNLTVAPLGFQLFHLPIVHGVIIFLTLLLAAWAVGKFGAATLVGLIGSAIVLFAGGPLPVIGFAVVAIIFDAILLLSRHKVSMKPISIAVAALATVLCSFLAGVINGVFVLGLPQPFLFVVAIWGGWNIVGGIIGLAVALPVIAGLERANVKKVKID